MKITAITFGKKSLIWSEGVPLMGLKVNDCAKILRESGADQIEVSFKTPEEYREQDLTKYSRRLDKICRESGYSEQNKWENIISEGFVFENQFTKIIIKDRSY